VGVIKYVSRADFLGAIENSHCSSNASISISRGSVAALPNFMKKLMQTHSILPSITNKMENTHVKTMCDHNIVSCGRLI
jgi:hypothetical protein